MLYLLLFFAVSTVAAQSNSTMAPMKLIAFIHGFVPQEVIQFNDEITPEEKEALEDATVKQNILLLHNSSIEIAMNESCPTFFEKSLRLESTIKNKYSKMSPEAIRLLLRIVHVGMFMLDNYDKGIKPSIEDLRFGYKLYIDKFKDLSEEAKTQFKEQYPDLYAVFSTNAYLEYLESHEILE